VFLHLLCLLHGRVRSAWWATHARLLHLLLVCSQLLHLLRLLQVLHLLLQELLALLTLCAWLLLLLLLAEASCRHTVKARHETLETASSSRCCCHQLVLLHLCLLRVHA
jgi:hypothetical protein